jgi:RNA polymerase sigma factor (sigma-70 family)
VASKQVAVTGGSQDDELREFDSLVRLHRPRVYRFLLASLRNQDTAENLTQDCFVKAYQAREQFRGASSIGTWFMQIAANLVRDHESSSRLKFWRRTLRSDADLTELGAAIQTGNSLPKRWHSFASRCEASGLSRRVCRRDSERCCCCGLSKIWTFSRSPK